MLSTIQAHLEAIYRTRAPDVRHFLLDEEQVSELLGPGARRADEWVLVRAREEGTVDLGVYIAGQHLERLDRAATPMEAVDAHFSAWCAAIEGVSHFLMLVERARRSEPVRMLELEAQAEVDKYVCARLVLPAREREWRWRLFRSARLAEDLSFEERDRYLEAGRLAEAFCEWLDTLPHADALLATLREFWRDSGARRLDRMRRLAA